MSADSCPAALLGADEALGLRLNRAARRWSSGRTLVAATARWLAGVEVILMVLLALGGRRRSALRMLGAVALVYAASEGLGAAWPRARPFASMADIEVLVPHAPGRSFPSRHVASGLAMAAIGGSAHRRLGTTMSVVAWALGVSRVAAGLHYPSDVVGGAVLGWLVARCFARSA
jgi:undecaprenyl-diphosphatase